MNVTEINSAIEGRLEESVDGGVNALEFNEVGSDILVDDEDEIEINQKEDEGATNGLSGESDLETDSSEDDYDPEVLNAYEKQLSDAQREWERSLEQLWQVCNWVILPLVGKILGRRVATMIWKRVMGWVCSE